ncbi:alpha tubulin suppressor [Linderina pennispora]|nr:alpha tubulin suppressor [Linderina pennispora]
MDTIFALGSNSGGQLATGSLDDAHFLTETVFGQECGATGIAGDAVIAGGGNHTFLVRSKGRLLFGSGTNADGQLGIPTASSGPYLHWAPIQFPGESVYKIACGWSHTLLLNDTHRLFSAGSSGFGQLGINPEPRVSKAMQWSEVSIGSSAKIVDIACGMRHSLALTGSGDIFGWGANRCGQLGVPGTKKQPNVCEPILVSAGLPPISMIACGRSHSVAIASDRVTVFVAGQDKYAQCGPSSYDAVVGTWRSFRLSSPARKLCSGWEFGAVLLDPAEGSQTSRCVTMWGRSDHGQLGKMPMAMPGGSRDTVDVALESAVVDIACGSNHTVAVLSNGSVWAWGWNEHANAGDPSLANVVCPRQLWPAAAAPGRLPSIGTGYGNTLISISCD